MSFMHYDTRIRLQAMIDGGMPITLQDILDAHERSERVAGGGADIFDTIEDIARRRIQREFFTRGSVTIQGGLQPTS